VAYNDLSGFAGFATKAGLSHRTFAGCQMRDSNGGEFGTAECSGEAEEQQGAVAQAGQIGPIGASIWRR
jgi:hypothetical protein